MNQVTSMRNISHNLPSFSPLSSPPSTLPHLIHSLQATISMTRSHQWCNMGSNGADLRSQRTKRQRLRVGCLNKECFPKEVGCLCSKPQKKEPEWCKKGADQETSLTREGEVRNETGDVNRRVLKWNARISPSWHSWKQKRNYFKQLRQIYYFIIQRQRNRGLNSPARFLQHSLGHWEGLPKTK